MKTKKKPPVSKFGTRWLTLRKGLKLTQAELAEKLEISSPYLSLIENGLRPCPSLEVVKRLSTLTKKSIDYVVGADIK